METERPNETPYRIRTSIKDYEMKNKLNGYVKIFFIGLALAGIIWNAAILHNDVKHIKADIKEIKAILSK